MGFNPQALTKKWQDNFSRSADAYKAGIMGVTQAPGIAAAAAAQKYVQGVQNAVNNNLYQRRVAAVPLSTWQNNAVNKGVQRMAGGAAAGAAKMLNYMTQAAPVYEDIKQTAKGMTNDGSTSSQSAIVAMAIDKMKQLKQSLT